MINFKQSDYTKPLPVIQMISLIDILFINLAFFMAMFLHFNFESQLNISVPQAKSSVESGISSQEIIINVLRDGTIILNQKKIGIEDLASLLTKTTEIYPGQAVVVRADEKAYHQYVVSVLDACAKSKIWNVSFAATKEK